MDSVDFSMAEQQAATLAKVAQGIFSQSHRLSEIAADLKGIWHGDTADAYRKKLEEFSSQLYQEARGCQYSATNYKNKIIYRKWEIAQAQAESENGVEASSDGSISIEKVQWQTMNSASNVYLLGTPVSTDSIINSE